MNKTPSASVAIIGAGIAGLTLALRAREAGLVPVVHEKSRGPGGRLASKRTPSGDSVDMGAQFFTIRNPRFRNFLERHAGQDAYALWNARLLREDVDGTIDEFHHALRYVGTPRMTALSRALTSALPVHAGTGVTAVVPADDGWYVQTEQEQQGPFERVVITAPPEQAQAMVPKGIATSLELDSHRMHPCWALALRFETPLDTGFDGMQLAHESLGWVARNSSKPGRGTEEWWVVHANSTWSDTHRDTSPTEVAAALMSAFRQRFEIPQLPSEHLLHRWLYARPAPGPTPGFLTAAGDTLGFCGDWLTGGRVEGAFESADALARHWFGTE